MMIGLLAGGSLGHRNQLFGSESSSLSLESRKTHPSPPKQTNQETNKPGFQRVIRGGKENY